MDSVSFQCEEKTANNTFHQKGIKTKPNDQL